MESYMNSLWFDSVLGQYPYEFCGAPTLVGEVQKYRRLGEAKKSGKLRIDVQ